MSAEDHRDEMNNREEGVQDPDAVVDAEFVVMDTEDRTYDRYTAVVKSVHEGFCFLHQVRFGTQAVATNGDVFCPSDDFEVGDDVMFDDLNPDREHEGRFRTEGAIKHLKQELVVSDGKTVNALVLREAFENARVPYHNNSKPISDSDKLKALKNVPFDQMLLSLAHAVSSGDMPLSEYAERMLSEQAFPELAPFNVSSSIAGDVDEAAEAQRIEEMAQEYAESGMLDMANSLRDQYRKFAGARKVFELMSINDILRLDTVIPMRYLPELFVACPVWFMERRKVDVESDPEFDQTYENDPKPSEATRFVCDQVGTKEFTWLFQIYNRRTRPLSMFKGRDIMPPSIMKIMQQARKTFDYVAILTPYHDIASKEWQDPTWHRNIDPFLIGFNKDVPYIFVLGRWSGTGLFPLFLDMVADTMSHLKTHKALLQNFISNTYWYKGGEGICLNLGDHKNTVLEPFADEVLQAYDDECLFSFLRGEESNNPSEEEDTSQ